MRTEVTQVVTLRLLKGFALLVGDDRVTLSSSAQRLLAFLALQDRPRTRTYVARTLWPEATTARANANLRSSLWRALRTGYRVIDASAHEMSLAGNITVDIHDAVARAHRLLDKSCLCDDILDRRTRDDLSADLPRHPCDAAAGTSAACPRGGLAWAISVWSPTFRRSSWTG